MNGEADAVRVATIEGLTPEEIDRLAATAPNGARVEKSHGVAFSAPVFEWWEAWLYVADKAVDVTLPLLARWLLAKVKQIAKQRTGGDSEQIRIEGHAARDLNADALLAMLQKRADRMKQQVERQAQQEKDETKP